MIDRADDIRIEWLAGAIKVGVTAGASAPESLVKEVIARLTELGPVSVQEQDGVQESTIFPVPKILRYGKSE
jgi:4-hydroxy-3-methylbut-2-enyl diphosphate reductase